MLAFLSVCMTWQEVLPGGSLKVGQSSDKEELKLNVKAMNS